MNCLEYALKFWDKNPSYRIYYNSDHCINLPESTTISNDFLPIEEYGIEYFKGAFDLTEEYSKLLEKYFKHYKP